jgi:hypothetical protein
MLHHDQHYFRSNQNALDIRRSIFNPLHFPIMDGLYAAAGTNWLNLTQFGWDNSRHCRQIMDMSACHWEAMLGRIEQLR